MKKGPLLACDCTGPQGAAVPSQSQSLSQSEKELLSAILPVLRSALGEGEICLLFTCKRYLVLMPVQKSLPTYLLPYLPTYLLHLAYSKWCHPFRVSEFIDCQKIHFFAFFFLLMQADSWRYNLGTLSTQVSKLHTFDRLTGDFFLQTFKVHNSFQLL